MPNTDSSVLQEDYIAQHNQHETLEHQASSVLSKRIRAPVHVEDYIAQHHQHETVEHQASSVLSKRIRAPVDVVWSTVRKFDEPQSYKSFVKSCIMHGDVRPGNMREVCVISGLPATTSLEMLETLDDEQHIMCYRVLGGDHRLHNYKSVVTLHPENMDSKPGTLVIESFSVDVPDGNTKDDAKFFVEALIKCNLKTLAEICERER